MADLPENRELVDSPETLLSLYRISRLASESQTSQDVFEGVMNELKRLFAPIAGSISFVSPDSGLLEKEYAFGYPMQIGALSLHLDKGITGRAAFIGETLLVPDVSKDIRYVKLIEGVACKMAAPMISNGQIIGTIDIDSDRVAAFDKEDASRFELVVDEATRAIRSSWKNRQLANNSEQLNALIEVGQNIVSNLEIQGLWDTIADSALELTGSRMSAIQLLDRSKNCISLKSVRPVNEAYEHAATEVAPHDSMVSSAIRTRKQIEFANITTPDYHDLKDIPKGIDVTSCLATPMIFEEEVIGVITIFTRNRHRFANSEKRLLRALASLAAIAAENASLYARVISSEDLLRKSERLTTLGLLSAEIAHEIRNPLTVIKLLFGSLGLDFPDTDPRAKDKQIIREKIDQLEEIVTKVLSFGKAPESLFSRWDIEELIDDTRLLVRHKMKQQRVEIAFVPSANATHVAGNKGQLQQVLLNLIINAAEAMPEGGELRIESKLEQRSDGKRIALYVSDTGTGIPEDMLGKIFDSFLTLKPEGTGLGLAIAKRILKSHRGDISVIRSSPEGTTMRIELPLA